MTDPGSPRDETDPSSSDPGSPNLDSGSTGAGSVEARKPVSPAAAAASRARRIGGRTAASRAPEQAVGADPSPAAESDDAGTSPVPTSAVAATTASEPTKLGTQPKDAKEPKAPKAAKEPRAAKEPKAPRDPNAPSRLLLWTPAAVLTVAAIVFAVLVAVSTHGKQWDRPSAGSQRDVVLAAAKACVVTTNSYSYTAIPAFEKKALTCASGQFAKQLTKTVADVIAKDAPGTKQVQKLQINNGGVIDVTDGGQWDILIYGQLSVTNATTTTPRIDPFASVVRMTRVGGRWTISSLCTAQFAGPINSCYT